MRHILKSLKKQTDNKYLNMYIAVFDTDGGEVNYQFASRRSQDQLVLTGGKGADAVRVVPFFKKGGKLYVALISEFRYPVGRRIYSVPAGLIDRGEGETEALKRELMEEIGAKLISFERTDEASFTSAGMSDESIVCYEAEVELTGEKNLDEGEDIETVVVELGELPEFLEKNEFGLQARLQLKAFYYKMLAEERK